MARHHWWGRAVDSYGNIKPETTINVYLAGTTNSAKIYPTLGSANVITLLQTDTLGRFDFWVDDFDYERTQLFDIVVGELTYGQVDVFNLTGADTVDDELRRRMDEGDQAVSAGVDDLRDYTITQLALVSAGVDYERNWTRTEIASAAENIHDLRGRLRTHEVSAKGLFDGLQGELRTLQLSADEGLDELRYDFNQFTLPLSANIIDVDKDIRSVSGASFNSDLNIITNTDRDIRSVSGASFNSDLNIITNTDRDLRSVSGASLRNDLSLSASSLEGDRKIQTVIDGLSSRRIIDDTAFPRAGGAGVVVTNEKTVVVSAGGITEAIFTDTGVTIGSGVRTLEVSTGYINVRSGPTLGSVGYQNPNNDNFSISAQSVSVSADTVVHGDFQLESATPSLYINKTGEAVDEGRWEISVVESTGIFELRTVQDAPSTTGSAFLRAVRLSGQQMDHVEMPIQVQGSYGNANVPSWSFTSDPDTGMYLAGASQLGFSTANTNRLTIEADGTLVVGTSNYENLVTGDDDIPNKKYIEISTDDLRYDINQFTLSTSANIIDVDRDLRSVSGASLRNDLSLSGASLEGDRSIQDQLDTLSVRRIIDDTDTPRAAGAGVVVTDQNTIVASAGGLYGAQFSNTSAALYFAGNRTLVTVTNGFEVGDAKRSSITHDGNHLTIENKQPSQNVNLKAADAAGNSDYLFSGNAGAEASLYYAGSQVLSTTLEGIQIRDTSGDDPKMQFNNDLGQGQGYIRFTDAGGFEVYDDVNNELVIDSTPNAGVALNYNGSTKFSTTATGFTFTDGSATPATIYFVGDNVYIDNNDLGGNIYLNATKTGTGLSTLLYGDPDGQLSEYYAGVLATATTERGPGLNVTGALEVSGSHPVWSFDPDETLAGNSHNALPTQRAVKGYVDTTSASLSAASLEGDRSLQTTLDNLSSTRIIDDTAVPRAAGAGVVVTDENTIVASAGGVTQAIFSDTGTTIGSGVTTLEISAGFLTVRDGPSIGTVGYRSQVNDTFSISSETGSVHVSAGGVKTAEFTDTGFSLYSGGTQVLFATDTTGVWVSDGGAGAKLYQSSNNFLIYNTDHGGSLIFTGENSVGANKNIFWGDPDEYVRLYYAGELAITTTERGPGLNVTGALEVSGSHPIWSFDPDGTLAGDSHNALPTQRAVKEYADTVDGNLTTHMADTSTHGVGEIVGRTEAQTLTTKTLTSPIINTILTATGKTGGVFTEDGAAELYYNESKTIETMATGIGVRNENAGDDEWIYYYNAAGGARAKVGVEISNFSIQYGSSLKTGIVGVNNAGIGLYYDNNKKVETTATGFTITGLTETTTLNIGTTIAITGVLDEDAMGSDSAVSLVTQQSVKAYVDSGISTLSSTRIIDDTAATRAAGAGVVVTDQNTIVASAGGVMSAQFSETDVELYYGGVKKFETTAAGISITDGTATAATIGFTADDLYISNNDSGGSLFLSVNDSGLKSVLAAIAGGTTVLYNNGAESIRTMVSGVEFGSVHIGELYSTGNDIVLANTYDTGKVTIKSKDTGSNLDNLFIGDPDGSVDLYYAGTLATSTTDRGPGLNVVGALEVSGSQPVWQFDTDESLTGNSNNALPTQRAVKQYVDSGLSTLYSHRIIDNTVIPRAAGAGVVVQDENTVVVSAGGVTQATFSDVKTTLGSGMTTLEVSTGFVNIRDGATYSSVGYVDNDDIFQINNPVGAVEIGSGATTLEVSGGFINVRDGATIGSVGYLQNETDNFSISGQTVTLSGGGVLRTTSTGIDITDGTAVPATIGFVTDDLHIINNDASGNIILQAQNSTADGLETIFSGGADGFGARLFYNNLERIQMTNGGFSFKATGATTGGQILYSGADLYLDNNEANGNFYLQLEKAATGASTAIKADPDGAVELYYDAGKKFETTAAGISITDGTATAATIGFSADDLYIANNDPGGLAYIYAEKAATGQAILFAGNADGAVNLYYQGLLSAYTTDGGLNIKDTSGTAPGIFFVDDALNPMGHFTWSGGNFEIYNNVNSQYFMYGGANGSMTIYHAGSPRIRTTAAGMSIEDGTATAATIGFTADDLYITNNDPDGEVYITAEKTGTGQSTLFRGDPDGGSSLYYANTISVSSRSDGARIMHPGGYALNIKQAAGYWEIEPVDANHGIRLTGTDGAENDKTLFFGDPATSAGIYYNGIVGARTTERGPGLDVAGALEVSGSHPVWAFDPDETLAVDTHNALPTQRAVKGYVDSRLNTANEWTATQNFNMTLLTDAASIAWNTDENQVCAVIITANRAMAQPSNLHGGAWYTLSVVQDGTGGWTMSWHAVFKWESGVAPTLASSPNERTIFSFLSDGTYLYGGPSWTE